MYIIYSGPNDKYASVAVWGRRHFLGLLQEKGIYSYEQRKKAVELYIKFDNRFHHISIEK